MIIELLFSALLAAPAVAADSPRFVVLSTQAHAAANQRLSARCSKPQFSVDALLSDAAARTDLATCTAEEGRDLFEYSVCRALQGAPGACDPLAEAKGSPAHCLAVAAEARFAFHALRDGDPLTACRNMLETDGVRGLPVEKNCGTLIKAVRAGIASTPCATLARDQIVTPQDSCEDIQASWSGVSQDCDRFKDAGTRRECVSRAALVSGLRDPAKCASSPACQALAAKSAAACDGLRVQFSRALCARVGKEVAAASALQPRPVEVLAKEKAAKISAAAVAAAAAAVAEQKAKVEAAAAKAKAESLASQEKVAKMAAAQSAKTAAAAAVVRTKAEAEAAKEAKAKAEIAKKNKPQFKKGAPMQTVPIEAKEIMKALEEGRPIPTPKPAPKKIPKEDSAPADE